ncbi:MAG: plastocyanin [Pseudohongiellaceae bacterium]|jgi:plastocyanin
MNAMRRTIEKQLFRQNAQGRQAPRRSSAVVAAGALLLAVLTACGEDETAPKGGTIAPSGTETTAATSGESTGGDSGESSTPIQASQDVDPENTGRITGQMSFVGPVPPRAVLPVIGDAFCMGVAKDGPGLLSETLVVSDGKLAGAFVWIAAGLDDWRFPRASGSVAMDQAGCTYVPHVIGLQKGQSLEMINSDPVLHNVHSVGQKNGEKNLAMPTQGMKIEMKFKRPETMIELQCDVHAWMTAYVGVVDHPCFDVSATDGSFQLEGVPPGDYVVRMWHESLGTTEVEVSVSANETADLGEVSF